MQASKCHTLTHTTELQLRKDLKTTIFLPSPARELENLEMRDVPTTQLVCCKTTLVNSRMPSNSTRSSFKYAKPLVMYTVKHSLTTVLVLTTWSLESKNHKTTRMQLISIHATRKLLMWLANSWLTSTWVSFTTKQEIMRSHPSTISLHSDMPSRCQV